MYVGQTGLPAVFTVVDDTGAPINITGSTTFVLTIYNPTTQARKNGAGVFGATNASLGQITYAWNTADTAVAGQYTLALSFQFEGAEVVCDPVQWIVLPPGGNG